MATASTQPGETAAPTQPAEGNPFAGIGGTAELDTLLAAGLADDATEAPADRTPAAPAEADAKDSTKPAKTGKTKAAPKTPEIDNTAEIAKTEITDLSALIEEDGDDTDGDDDGDTDESDTEGSDADGEGDDTGDDGEPKDDAHMPKWVQERLGKLSKQKREAKAAAEAAEAKLASVTAEVEALRANRIVAAPTPANPLAGVTDEAGIDQHIQAAKAVRAWCIDNLEGGSFKDAKGEIVDLSASEVARRKAWADEMLSEHIPARKQWLEQRRGAQAMARESYATMFQPDTRMARARESVMRAMPQLVDHPEADLFIGDAIMGAMIRAGQLKVFRAGKAPAKPAAAPEPAPRSPAKPAVHTAPVPGGKAKAAAESQLAAAAMNGDARALADAIAASLV